MSSPGQGAPPPRRIGELAALVSAVAAVAGILLAVFGFPQVGGSAVNRNIADRARDTPAPALPGPPSATASGSAGSGAADSAPSDPPPPALPRGWQRVNDPGLTVVFAVPDGWVQKVDSDIQNTWHSPDRARDLSVKRDTSYGSTPREAAEGQLAWYRKSEESSMAGIEVSRHTTRQNGRDALWLEIDYHYVKQSEPRRRVEVFVAGRAGQVYQLLLDSAAGPGGRAEQQRMFATARAQLRIDVDPPA